MNIPLPARHGRDLAGFVDADSAEGAAATKSVVLAHIVELFVLDVVLFGRSGAESGNGMRPCWGD